MNIAPLQFRFDVAPLRAELGARRGAWNEHRWRTQHPRSPHRECDDIWLRYNSLENLGAHFNDEHCSVWYPVAAAFPAARLIAEEIAQRRRQELAGVLITRIPPHKQVYPHRDFGWHAENTDKIGLLVEGNHRQSFCFDDATHRCEAGESFEFCNQATHWVTNDTDEPRITLIVCLRRH